MYNICQSWLIPMFIHSIHQWFTAKERASVCHKQCEWIDREHTQLCFWQTSNLISVDRPSMQWLIKVEADERSWEKAVKVISPDSIAHRWKQCRSTPVQSYSSLISTHFDYGHVCKCFAAFFQVLALQLKAEILDFCRDFCLYLKSDLILVEKRTSMLILPTRVDRK